MSIRRSIPSLIRLGMFLLALPMALVLAGCETNPATGRNQFQALSTQEEIAMGTQAMPELVKEYGGRVANADLQNYVVEIGRKLAATTEGKNPALPWEFTLLDSDVINAFAMPGGKVFMSRGLAQRMTNEAQLAGVLGHEVGHVTARHINDQMARQGLTSVLVGVGSAAADAAGYGGLGQVGETVGGVVLLKYSRDQELEADKLGLRYMTRNGYDPAAMRQVMQILKSASGGGKQAEIFSTHPDPDSRIQQIDSLLRGEYAGTQNNPQFQLKEGEFRTRFLSKVGPVRPAAPRPQGRGVGGVRDLEFAFDEPASWCLHCAAAGDVRTAGAR